MNQDTDAENTPTPEDSLNRPSAKVRRFYISKKYELTPAVRLIATRLYTMADLRVWQHQVPEVTHAILPPYICRSNPLVCDNLVIASLFSKGRICAVHKDKGEVCWEVLLPYLGGIAVYMAEGYLFGGTSRALLSLDPANGKQRWQFAPYQGNVEAIYSAPVYSEGHVFIGDRAGRFYCLNAASGEVVWRVQTSRHDNCDVNATALVHEDRVITATNAKLVLAYEATTGMEIWRQELADCSIHEILRYGEIILVHTGTALYGLSPTDGRIVHQWSWENSEVKSIAVADDVLCVVISNTWVSKRKGVKGKRPRSSTSTTVLLGLPAGQEQWRLSYPPYAGPVLRWDTNARVLFESTAQGMGIVDVQQGRRFAAIHDFGCVKYEKVEVATSQTGLPCAEEGMLYVLTNGGLIAQLRSPLPDGENNQRRTQLDA